MVNTPIPHSLKSEAKKAAKILREFTMAGAKAGPDKLIPAGILLKAKGLAIITVFKAGFLVTARGGSGIVIAKVEDSFDYASGWSAPSAIGLAGLGGGFEIGMEVTDFVIILNSRTAVDAFSKGGNLTLGGNFTIAAGPLGRNIEGDIALRSPAAIYTYSKTKGIFAGISIEGSALIERKDANRKFYGRPIRAYQILQGEVEIPEECKALYSVLKEHQEMAARSALKMAKSKALKCADQAQGKAEHEASTKYGISLDSWRSRSSKSKSKPSRSSTKKAPPRSQSEWFVSDSSLSSSAMQSSASSTALQGFSTNRKASYSMDDPWADAGHYNEDNEDEMEGSFHDQEKDGMWMVAEFPFKGQLPCDLSFDVGEKLYVSTRTNRQDDWWEGINSAGRQGIFPANFFRIMP